MKHLPSLREEMPGYKLYLRKQFRRSGKIGLEKAKQSLLRRLSESDCEFMSQTTAQTDECSSITFDLDASGMLEMQSETSKSSLGLSSICEETVSAYMNCDLRCEGTERNGKLESSFNTEKCLLEPAVGLANENKTTEMNYIVKELRYDFENDQYWYKISSKDSIFPNQSESSFISKAELLEKDPLCLLRYYENRLMFKDCPNFKGSSLIMLT